ncbi:MAG: putative acyl-CoA dehydrogenase [Frankiales bacterium]|nr:putative acyl-CoA dehydrogenase [Frankiales bacterium]
MDFTPTEEQEAVRGLAQQLFATATHPGLGVEGFDTELWAKLVDAGLLGLSRDLPLAVSSVLAEEAGKAAARVPLVPVLAALPALTDAALVEDVLGGSRLVVPALQADGWKGGVTATGGRLTGSQIAVAWASEATHAIVSAGEDLYLVDLAAEGVTRAAEEVSSHEPAATIELAGAPAVLLEEKASTALQRLTLLTCSYAVGVAEASLLIAAKHVSTREQFGKPLATFQAITYQVADCYIDVECMRLTTAQAVWRVDEGHDAAEQTAIAAFWGADGIHRVTSKAVHLHGGLGVDVSYPLHKWFLIGKVLELSLGGAQRTLESLGDLIAAR